MIAALTTLLPRIIEVRDAVGWNPATWERLPAKLMCVISELHELQGALEAYPRVRDERAEELADVMLYLLVIFHDVWGAKVSRAVGRGSYPYRPPAELTDAVRAHVVRAFEAWRFDDQRDAGIAIELAIIECGRLARGLGIDLPAACAAKTEINATRPPRHGGKHPDS